MNEGITARPKGGVKAIWDDRGAIGRRSVAASLPVRGERGLMAAILHRGIVDVLGLRYGPDYRDAVRWALVDRSPDEVFSFVNICEEIGIDPNTLRRILQRLHDAGVVIRATRGKREISLAELLEVVSQKATSPQTRKALQRR